MNFDLNEYQRRLEALFVRFQSVQSAGFTSGAYKPGLDGMKRLDAVLGHPWKGYRCIHVAGTNGKGSVCSLLAAALAGGSNASSATATSEPAQKASAGGSNASSATATHGPAQKTSADVAPGQQPGSATVGLYTSPHLLDFRERIKVVTADGYREIPREDVWEFLERYEAQFEGLSFFEITTGMALWWFARQRVGMAVIETGLGGRLDSTNIITPALSIVTSIGLDHCAILGNTREAIAREKAGIFKPGVPAVVATRDSETEHVFEEAAAKVGCPLVFASDIPTLPGEDSIKDRMDLTGPCREINLHTVMVCLEGVRESKVAAGIAVRLENAARLTGLHGRWERLQSSPEVICDIGHNPPALRENFARLEKECSGGRPLIIVYGIMADKDLAGIAPLMPRDAVYILAAPESPRALPAPELLERLNGLRPELDCRIAGCVNNAVATALRLARDLDNALIYIGGSTFVVAEAIPCFTQKGSK